MLDRATDAAWLLSRNGADPSIGWRDLRLLRNRNEICVDKSPVLDAAPSVLRAGGSVADMCVAVEVAGTGAARWCRPAWQLCRMHELGAVDCFWLGRLHSQAGNYFHAECYLQDSLRQDHPLQRRESLRLLAHSCHRIADPLRAAEKLRAAAASIGDDPLLRHAWELVSR